ncbi:MAG: hypothetical protein C4530_11650 [Desulfobacteraceae bacterium]|nr:MAG: hypothetical protein C4530_11650 [Desulfobacteraceae bacterium]
MTHTLHRIGDAESLREDYILLFLPARGINLEGSEKKMQQIWEVISHHREGLVNFGNLTDGNSRKTRLEDLKKAKSRIIHAVFKDRNSLKACLAELKEADFGISVVVSGLEKEVFSICEEAGLTPHTVNDSLGFHGKTDKLPPEPVLEITTMCGHALVAAGLVEAMIAAVRTGEKTYEEAAGELSRMCECGIFNPQRAEQLLRKMVPDE